VKLKNLLEKMEKECVSVEIDRELAYEIYKAGSATFDKIYELSLTNIFVPFFDMFTVEKEYIEASYGNEKKIEEICNTALVISDDEVDEYGDFFEKKEKPRLKKYTVFFYNNFGQKDCNIYYKEF